MRIFAGTTQFHIEEACAVAIGKFDGIHNGHGMILDALLEERKKGLKVLIFTFDPSPAALFSGREEKSLCTKEEKRKRFEALGVDYLVEFPLTKETAAMDPREFVSEILVERLKAACVVAGTDLSFGKGGKGNAALLKQMGAERHLEVRILEKVCDEGREISSTYIREELLAGHLGHVQDLMGHPYEISGMVEHGRHLGTQWGIPTLNVFAPKEKLLPPRGVYFSNVRFHDDLYGDKIFHGMTNLGRKPTVQNEVSINLETFVYDFQDDVYGKRVTIELLKFKRPEQHFDSIDALRRQIELDVESGREYFREYSGGKDES